VNLTYEIKDNSYTIFKDGVAWIVQDGFFPYKAETIEESAKLHIDNIIEDFNRPAEPTNEEKVAELEAEIAEKNALIENLQSQLVVLTQK